MLRSAVGRKTAFIQKKAPLPLQARGHSAADRARTGTLSPARDFKSLASANSATAAYPTLLMILKKRTIVNCQMHLQNSRRGRASGRKIFFFWRKGLHWGRLSAILAKVYERRAAVWDLKMRSCCGGFVFVCLLFPKRKVLPVYKR